MVNDTAKDIVTLKYILDKLDSKFTMTTFEDRLILQKRIYLLQAFGLPLGYDFSWYIHGPYCSKLAQIGTTLNRIQEILPDKEEEFVSDVKFNDVEYEKKFKKFIKFLEKITPSNHYTLADRLEILASIHILYAYEYGSKDDILRRVANKKDYFEIEECKKSWLILEQEGFITQKHLVDDNV